MRAHYFRTGEDAMALPMVMVMTTVVGVVLVATLSLTTTTTLSSVVSKHIAERTYAAHAGIDTAIQRLRAGASFCDDRSTLPIPVNGHPVLVTCEPTEGSYRLGLGSWALYVNPQSSNPGIEVRAGSEVLITGPVFNGGSWSDDGAVIDVERGQVLSAGKSCRDAASAPAIVTTAVAGFSSCVAHAAPAPQDDPPLPTLPTGVLPATLADDPPSSVSGTGADACRVFEPGRYTTAAPFTVSPNMYFKSGVYFLDNLGAVSFERTRVAVAGQPSPADSSVLAGCASESSTRLGALFLLGGDSSINVDGAQLEIHAFVADAESTLPPVAIRTVEQSDIGTTSWLTSKAVSTIAASEDALTLTGDKATLALHGVVFTPRAQVSIDTSGAQASALLTAGLVAGRVSFTSTGTRQISVSSNTASGTRRLRLRAEAVDRPWCDGEKAGCSPAENLAPTSPNTRLIVAEATVTLSGRSDLAVQSWQVGS